MRKRGLEGEERKKPDSVGEWTFLSPIEHFERASFLRKCLLSAVFFRESRVLERMNWQASDPFRLKPIWFRDVFRGNEFIPDELDSVWVHLRNKIWLSWYVSLKGKGGNQPLDSYAFICLFFQVTLLHSMHSGCLSTFYIFSPGKNSCLRM